MNSRKLLFGLIAAGALVVSFMQMKKQAPPVPTSKPAPVKPTQPVKPAPTPRKPSPNPWDPPCPH